MAKGVLCFFFGICYEDDLSSDNQGVFDTPLQNGDTAMGTRAKRGAMDGDAVLTVHPNPTDDVVYIELRGAGIAHAVLYDLQGRVVGANDYSSLQGIAEIDMRNVPAGVYLLRVTDTNGREYQRKIAKK